MLCSELVLSGFYSYAVIWFAKWPDIALDTTSAQLTCMVGQKKLAIYGHTKAQRACACTCMYMCWAGLPLKSTVKIHVVASTSGLSLFMVLFTDRKEVQWLSYQTSHGIVVWVLLMCFLPRPCMCA